MNYPNYFKRFLFLLILTVFVVNISVAQIAIQKEPREQKLLNGLKLLVWNEPTAEKLTVKLRIHSGAAFDPKDKMGVMALLGEILFPSEQSKAFFIEDLEGSLDISTNYDYIEITATGKNEEALSMLQTIASAVTAPQINSENFKLVRDARLKRIQDLEKNPAYVADRIAAKRFFGDYPYGRSYEGTAESINKLDFADLLFAKERFLTADNATLAIAGKINPENAHRICRQLFGVWAKSDKKIPPTFAMPNEPDTSVQNIELSKTFPEFVGVSEIRYASRGIARKDKDYFAMRFLAEIMQNRFQAKAGSGFEKNISVIHERGLLGNLIFFKFSNFAKGKNDGYVSNSNNSFFNPLEWMKEPVSNAEFNLAKAKISNEIGNKSLVEKMLDIDTFRLVSVKDEMQKLSSVTQADVQRVVTKLAAQKFVQVNLF